MISKDIRLAIKTLRASKMRSLMTMTGIILGVLSVVTIVSFGEGVKRQVVGQITRQGGDLITIRGGNFVSRDPEGRITKVNQVSNLAFNNGGLSESDLDVVSRTPGAESVVPVMSINSGVRAREAEYNNGLIIATGSGFPAAIQQKLSYGSYFTDRQSTHVAVIGKRVAEELFKENVPIGLSLTIRGNDHVVIGIFDDFPPNPLPFNPDFNRGIFIPYEAGQQLDTGKQLVQILVRPAAGTEPAKLIAALNDRLKTAHDGQADFTILSQAENLVVVSDVLQLFTTFIVGVAAMSLIIGGLGIMNIMLAAVSERTREIGIRKAIGATNRQIASQFFSEAMVVSTLGGIIGLALAFGLNFGFRVLTDLQPVITWQVAVLAFSVSLLIGVVFGLIPAVRAARKDPIEALRYE